MTEALCQALETDKVLSEGQLLRHYTLFLSDLPAEVHTFNAYLAATHHSMKYYEVRFVTVESKYTKLAASALRHLAGVAEMRHLLGIAPSAWRSEAGEQFASEQPDALWLSPQGDVAIEYDAGSYGPDKVRHKVQAFTAYAGQVWGSASRKRTSYLARHLRAAGIRTAPVFAPWT